MKILALLAALFTVAPAASAQQTFAQKFLDKYEAYQTGIKDGLSDLSKPGSPKVSINDDIKAGFQQKLESAAKTAKCRAGERGPQLDCGKATPDSIQDGLDALGELASDWKDAVKKDAGKSLLEIFKPQIDQLKTQLKDAKIDSSDDQKLEGEISTFQDSLNGDKIRPGFDRRKPESYAEFTAAFQKVSSDVAAAVALAASDKGLTGSFLTDLESQWKKLLKQVDKSDLSKAFQAQFKQQLDQIPLGEGCPSIGKLDKTQSLADNLGLASVNGRWRRGAAAGRRCKPTDSDIEAASKALQAVAAQVTAALAKGSDGRESVYQIYRPQLQQLQRQLAQAKLDATDQASFQKRLTKMTDDFESGEQQSGRNGQRPQRAAPGMGKAVITPDEASAEIAGFAKDLKAAIELSQGSANKSDTDAQKFAADIQSLEKAINASKLDGPFKQSLLKQAEQALTDGCGGKGGGRAGGGRPSYSPTGKKGADSCSNATADSLAKGEAELQQAQAAFASAQKTDGSKTLTAIYQPQVESLKATLERSNIDATDKKALQQSITDFENRLAATDAAADSKRGAASPAKGKRTKRFASVDDAQAAFAALQQDVQAALNLAKSN